MTSWFPCSASSLTWIMLLRPWLRPFNHTWNGRTYGNISTLLQVKSNQCLCKLDSLGSLWCSLCLLEQFLKFSRVLLSFYHGAVHLVWSSVYVDAADQRESRWGADVPQQNIALQCNSVHLSDFMLWLVGKFLNTMVHLLLKNVSVFILNTERTWSKARLYFYTDWILALPLSSASFNTELNLSSCGVWSSF